MKNRNVEHDLLKILKNKEGEEVLYTIFKMANEQYNFEFEYLNDIPYDILMLYLEKVIVLGTKKDCVLKDTDGLNVILEFANNIKDIKYKDLDKSSLISIRYNAMIRLEKIKIGIKMKSSYKKMLVLLMTAIILSSMCAAIKKNINTDETLQSSTSYETGTVINTSEVFAYDNPEETLNEIERIPVTEVLPDSTLEDTNNVEIIIPVESDVDIICRMYNLSEEEFNVVCAIVMSEAKYECYEDAYAVINTIYNRTISKTWVEYIDRIYGQEVGKSLYYQAVTKGQFVVYENGRYKKYLDVREGESYQAIIDFLLSKEIKHNYLSFKSSNTNIEEFEQFVTGGNKYHNPLLEEDRIIEEEQSLSPI